MRAEFLHDQIRPSTLNDSRYRRQTVASLADTTWVWAFGIYHPAPLLGAPSSTPLKQPPTERAPRHAGAWNISPLCAIRPIVAAIRLWRARARSRQQLRELNDHMLRDIGLRREVRVYEFPKRLRHWD
jgi:uncharacterized protein YjiS (DUF1127 family)